jgi:hypothetical protein
MELLRSLSQGQSPAAPSAWPRPQQGSLRTPCSTGRRAPAPAPAPQRPTTPMRRLRPEHPPARPRTHGLQRVRQQPADLLPQRLEHGVAVRPGVRHGQLLQVALRATGQQVDERRLVGPQLQRQRRPPNVSGLPACRGPAPRRSAPPCGAGGGRRWAPGRRLPEHNPQPARRRGGRGAACAHLALAGAEQRVHVRGEAVAVLALALRRRAGLALSSRSWAPGAGASSARGLAQGLARVGRG